MEKILRSIIEINGTIPLKDLHKNLWKLLDFDLEFIVEEDRLIWEYIQSYSKSYSEPPSINTIRNFFEAQSKIEILDRLNEIEATKDWYVKSDFENLIREALKAQNERHTMFLLKDASMILQNGMTVGTGRSKKEYKGYQDSIRYIIEKSDKLMMSDAGQVFRTDITADAEKVKKEFQNTISNTANAWGRPTGLYDIDIVCKGQKPGELWVHAASVGELKCVSGSQKVFNHVTKKLERIDDLYDRNELPIVTALKNEGAEPTLVTAQTSHLVENGIRKVFNVKLRSGRELEITDNHPLWALNSKGKPEWKELKDLSVNDWVGVPTIMRVPEPREDFSDEEVKVLGYLLGDRNRSSDLSVPKGNEVLPKDFERELNLLGYEKRKGNHRTLLEKTGLWEKDSSVNLIPGELFGLPDHQIALLLGALWSTDVSQGDLTHNNDITYASASKEFATGIQGLLLRLGIQSSVNTSHREPCVVRVVTNQSKQAFCDLISVTGREDHYKELRSRIPEDDDREFPTALLKPLGNVSVKTAKGRRSALDSVNHFDTISAESLRDFSDLDPSLLEHLEGDVAWDRIESIVLKGEEMTYDLSVPQHHSFVVNDVITHNTSFALSWAYRTAILYGYNVYYYSLEMPVEQIRLILYAMHSNNPKFKSLGYAPLDYPTLRDGVDKDGNPISQEAIDFFNLVIDDIEKGYGNIYGRLYVECPSESNTTISMIKNRIEMVHKTTPIHLVFIDYLGLLSPERRSGDFRDDLNSIFKDAKRMCLTFNQGEKIPIVALHQINREGKKEADKNDGVYQTQALADSNEAERSADVISYTYLNQNLREAKEVLVGCIKNRDNPHWKPFLARVHFETRFLTNIPKTTGTIGINPTRNPGSLF